MKIAFGGEEGLALAPGELTPDEVAAAKAAGAKLEVRFSKTVQDSYLANCCGFCNAFTGSFHLHDYWYLATDENRVINRLSCARCEGRGNDEPDVEPVRAPKAVAPIAKAAPPPPIAAQPRRATPPAAAATRKAAVWGACGRCGAPSCPQVISNGSFYCIRCRATTPFVPDVPTGR